MSVTRRQVLAGAAAALAPMPAFAQEANWPQRPLRIIIPTAPGGSPDITSRLIGDKITGRLGQSIVVESMTTGGGVAGLQVVAKSAPDGYTLLLTNDGPVTINPNLYKKMPYDPKAELAPITQVVDAPFVLVINANVEAKTVAEFIALAKASPGKINYASGGNTSRLAAELFRLSAGIEIVNVPYNGSGQAILGVVGGEVHMMIDGITSSLPHVLSGKLRALGVGTKGRIKELPDIPAVAETLPGYIGTTWLGLFAPAGTPPEIVNKIQTTFAKVMHEPELRERMATLGMYPVANTPAEFAAFLDADTRQWERVIRDAKIQKLE